MFLLSCSFSYSFKSLSKEIVGRGNSGQEDRRSDSTPLAATTTPLSLSMGRSNVPAGRWKNRIKKQQLDLFADRTSTHTFRANQLRLSLAACAYVLMEAYSERPSSPSARASINTSGDSKQWLPKDSDSGTIMVRSS